MVGDYSSKKSDDLCEKVCGQVCIDDDDDDKIWKGLNFFRILFPRYFLMDFYQMFDSGFCVLFDCDFIVINFIVWKKSGESHFKVFV